jgi:cytochrome P450
MTLKHAPGPPVADGRFEQDPLAFLIAGHARFGAQFTALLAGQPTVVVGTSAGVGELFAGERGSLEVLNTPLVRDLFGRCVFNLPAAGHQRARQLLRPPLHAAVADLAAPLTRIAHDTVEIWGRGLDSLHEGSRELTHAMSASALLGIGPHDADAVELRRLFDVFVAATAAPSGRLRYGSASYWAGRRAKRGLLALFSRRAAAPRPDGCAAGVLPALAAAFTRADPAVGSVGEHLLALLIAARETTASLITWTLIELAGHPETADRCRPEAALAGGDPALLARRGGSPRLRAVLAEVERLHSPNIVSVRRTLRPVRLGEFIVPAGRRVAYSPAANHFDPETYPDPNTFRPERFAGREQRAAGLLTFGGGIHACLGRPLAELMTLTAVAAALRRGRPRLPAGAPERIRYLPSKAPAHALPFLLEPIEDLRHDR